MTKTATVLRSAHDCFGACRAFDGCEWFFFSNNNKTAGAQCLFFSVCTRTTTVQKGGAGLVGTQYKMGFDVNPPQRATLTSFGPDAKWASKQGRCRYADKRRFHTVTGLKESMGAFSGPMCLTMCLNSAKCVAYDIDASAATCNFYSGGPYFGDGTASATCHLRPISAGSATGADTGTTGADTGFGGSSMSFGDHADAIDLQGNMLYMVNVGGEARAGQILETPLVPRRSAAL